MAGGTFGGGSGTSASPYLVEDAADLNAVRNNLTAYYEQTADIDLSGYANWTPIGTRFYGIYDGGGFKITNMNINTYARHNGLFAAIDGGATLKNINIIGANVIAGRYVGLLTGSAECWDIYSKISIENCNVNGTVSGDDYAGLLVGYVNIDDSNAEILIEDCASSGLVTGDLSYNNGGLIGAIRAFDAGETVAVNNCFSIATITGSSSYCGGLIGWIDYQGTTEVMINNCYAQGAVTGDTEIGGLIGASTKWDSSILTISNCYAACQISGNTNCGGLIGYGEAYDVNSVGHPHIPTTNNCYYDSQIAGQSDTGKGEPKTTAEMKTQSTFSTWDFTDIWGINNSYPYLRWASPSLALQTRKAYASVIEVLETDPDASMNYGGKWYKFIGFLEEFEVTGHQAAGEKSTYQYGGDAITYNGQPYTYLASGITDPSGPGGYGSYTSATSRTVESLEDRENFVNFYYIYPPLGKVAQPTWTGKVLTWKDVENAESYTVRLYNASAECLDTQTIDKGVQRYDYTDLIENYMPAGSYIATVQAMPEVIT